MREENLRRRKYRSYVTRLRLYEVVDGLGFWLFKFWSLRAFNILLIN
jgi:hypothetical protein